MKSAKSASSDTETSLSYPMAGGHALEIVPDVLRTFSRHRHVHFWQAEAGGQLFGEIADNNVRLSFASEPKAKDLRSRFGFAPDRPTEQREINSKFKEGLHYLGDWHTHAEDAPTPSGTDIRNINECVRQSKHGLSGFLLIVVGRLPFPTGLFVGVAGGKHLAELKASAATILVSSGDGKNY